MKQEYTSYHKLKGGGYFVFAVTGRPIEVCRDHREIEEVTWFPLSEIGNIDTNVDVSIFNTLMKNITVGKTVEEYIDSPEIKARENSITKRIA